jgi:pimeloyl-ACP methyl ester carboxylesterase
MPAKRITKGKITVSSYSRQPNEAVAASNGVNYAYRDVGEGDVPLVLLQHFRGNLDNWDPALVDDLAATRRVITFDNAGVGGSTGTTPHVIEQMAHDAIEFITAIGVSQADILGFSIGSFVAQEIALIRPALVRNVVLASSAPKGAAGMHGWAPDVIGAIGKPETTAGEYVDVFFARSSSSRQAGQEALGRMYSRTEDRDTATTWATREAQYDAVCTWGIPDHSQLERVSRLDSPMFVANGDSDPMILPHYSYLLAGLIPQARVKIYPDSAHGFLFQHHAEFAADVDSFLRDPRLSTGSSRTGESHRFGAARPAWRSSMAWDDLAIAHVDAASAGRGDVLVVGDDHHCGAVAVQLAHQVKDLLAGRRVQVSCRFVGEDNRRAADRGPGDCHPLAFTAGQFRYRVPDPVSEPHPGERFHRGGTPPAFG